MASLQYVYVGAAATCSHTDPLVGNTGSGRGQFDQLHHPIMEQIVSDVSNVWDVSSVRAHIYQMTTVQI